MVHYFAPSTQQTFETDAFGYRYRGRLDSYIDREVYFLGEYDPGVLRLLGLLAGQRPGAVFLDVGANVGQHTLFATRHFSAVHACEPFPPLVEILRDQITRNGLGGVVSVHPVGLGEDDMEGEYAAPADDRAGYGGFDNPDPALTRWRLPIRRGDRYLAERGVTRIDVIKIDVEGSERRVLEGLRGLVERVRPAIVMEYWASAWPQGLRASLPEGYRVWALGEHASRWGIVGGYRLSLEDLTGARDGGTVIALPGTFDVPDGVAVRHLGR